MFCSGGLCFITKADEQKCDVTVFGAIFYIQSVISPDTLTVFLTVSMNVLKRSNKGLDITKHKDFLFERLLKKIFSIHNVRKISFSI